MSIWTSGKTTITLHPLEGSNWLWSLMCLLLSLIAPRRTTPPSCCELLWQHTRSTSNAGHRPTTDNCPAWLGELVDSRGAHSRGAADRAC
mmetsp:Transcript_131634/g.421110  ORF Transcript_131634/g.421110 Transcript_131634/m.421110 type:complete len:90 (-) Transcript_131634:68-337(-)